MQLNHLEVIVRMYIVTCTPSAYIFWHTHTHTHGRTHTLTCINSKLQDQEAGHT